MFWIAGCTLIQWDRMGANLSLGLSVVNSEYSICVYLSVQELLVERNHASYRSLYLEIKGRLELIPTKAFLS